MHKNQSQLIYSWALVSVMILVLTTNDATAEEFPPLEQLACHKCDSVSLPECAISLNSNILPQVFCKSAYACAKSIVDSVTYRGCSTNTPIGPDYYKECTESLCNKGVFPPGRLKCHQCNGTECTLAPKTKPTPCLNFNETDYCYTDVINEAVTFRGCLSDTSRPPGKLAVLCDFNGCNDLPGVTTLTCSKCDSAINRGCKIDLFEISNKSCEIAINSSCEVKQLLGRKIETCFLYHNLNRVVRGCTVDGGLLSSDSRNFVTCTTSQCNRKCLPPQVCLTCDSSKDGRCKTNPISLDKSTCAGAETSSCYLCELDNGTITRGCGAPSAPPGTVCNQCDGGNCNAVPLTKCYKCTTDESPNCAQWINANIISKELCSNSTAKCVMATFRNRRTVRGCESPQLYCNGTQTNCAACAGNLCNTGVFPPKRLQCHQCDGCNDVVNDQNLAPCSVQAENDSCLALLSSRRTFLRGCRSDRLLFYECLLAGRRCLSCTQPGCNSMPRYLPSSLYCHVCSHTEESCSWHQDDSSLKLCQRDLEFGSKETCFTKRYPNGSTTRGCSLDEDIEEMDPLVQICEDDGCNNANTIAQRCIQCRANISEENDCSIKIDNNGSDVCNRSLVTHTQRGCYVRIIGPYVERGCVNDLRDDEIQNCASDQQCSFCMETECNIASALELLSYQRSSGTVASISFGLYVAICVFINLQEIGL